MCLRSGVGRCAERVFLSSGPHRDRGQCVTVTGPPSVQTLVLRTDRSLALPGRPCSWGRSQQLKAQCVTMATAAAENAAPQQQQQKQTYLQTSPVRRRREELSGGRVRSCKAPWESAPHQHHCSVGLLSAFLSAWLSPWSPLTARSSTDSSVFSSTTMSFAPLFSLVMLCLPERPQGRWPFLWRK